MAKFVLAYHGGGGMAEDPKAREEIMAAWGAWFGSLGEAIVDGGNPIAEAKTVASNGSLTGGGGANPLTGYSIITADSFDAAVAHAKGCPVLGAGGSVEVCEAMPI